MKIKARLPGTLITFPDGSGLTAGPDPVEVPKEHEKEARDAASYHDSLEIVEDAPMDPRKTTPAPAPKE